jgi:hypothetical protein
MVLHVIAIEDIQVRGSVCLLFNDSNQISCRNATAFESPEAIARRDIAKGESVTFDTGRDTADLARPRGHDYHHP